MVVGRKRRSSVRTSGRRVKTRHPASESESVSRIDDDPEQIPIVNLDDEESEQNALDSSSGRQKTGKQASSSVVSDEDGPNMLKIMVSTDNHLGYLEKHPIRGDDSFRSFEEVLALAKHQKVDMLLLGGDLFHDNKPSVTCLRRTVNLLRTYCYGPEAVELQIYSDPGVNFHTSREVNFLDPFQRISLPIFSIHGNHDDPVGGSSVEEQTSVLDILQDMNVLNYFGRSDTAKKVELSPILLQKGITRLALYGLGNIRDERLWTLWKQERNLSWKVPVPTSPESESENSNDDETSCQWFNLFVLHQNRALRGTTKAITPDMLPRWLDLVVWGHEHECRIDLESESPPITQPGSSVATSLSEGESKPKKVGILSICGDEWSWRTLPLLSVRPFRMDTVSLSELQPPLNPADDVAVQNRLVELVTEKMEDAKAEAAVMWGNPRQFSDAGDMDWYSRPVESRHLLPLVRLRVEYSGGFNTLNASRFGQAFVGKVANASDILMFFKQQTKRGARRGLIRGVIGNDDLGNYEESEGEDVTLNEGARRQEKKDEIRIPDLVQEALKKQGKLEILSLKEMSAALDRFVNKMEPNAIAEAIQKQCEDTRKELLKTNSADVDLGNIVPARNHTEQAMESAELAVDKRANLSRNYEVPSSEDDDLITTTKRTTARTTKPAASTRKALPEGKRAASRVKHLESDEDSGAGPSQYTSRTGAIRANTAKLPASTKRSKAASLSKKAPPKSKRSVSDDSDGSDSESQGSEFVASKSTRGVQSSRGRPAASRVQATRKPPQRAATSRAGGPARYDVDSEDEDDIEELE